MKSLSGIYEARSIEAVKNGCAWMIEEEKKRYGDPPSEKRLRKFLADYVATKDEVDMLVAMFLPNTKDQESEGSPASDCSDTKTP